MCTSRGNSLGKSTSLSYHQAVISKQCCSRLLPETIKQVIIISAPLANGIHLSAQGKMLISFALKQYIQPLASEIWLPTLLLKIISNWGAKNGVLGAEITRSLLHLTGVASSKYRQGTRSYRFHQEKDKNSPSFQAKQGDQFVSPASLLLQSVWQTEYMQWSCWGDFWFW